MAELTHNWKSYNITEELQASFPDLIKLILATESMNDDERQYWFDIMSSMTEEQIDRLFDILETERKKLEELELKYQKEIKNLNEKHLIEWQEVQMKDSKKKIASAEQKDNDKGNADDVLDMLNDL